MPLMAANPQIYNVSILPDTYYRFFEVALGYFIFDGKSPGYANNYDFEVYSELVGGSLDEGISGKHKYIMQGKLFFIKKYDGNLWYYNTKFLLKF